MKHTIVAITTLLCCAVTLDAQDLTRVDFHLRDINGEEQSFQDYLHVVRGADETPKKGIVVISFWGLCTACKQEMKALKNVYEVYAPRNLHILAINVNNVRSTAKVRTYVTVQKLPYDFWLDPTNEVFRKLGGQLIPYTLIVNSDGKLIAKHVGFTAGDEKQFEKDIVKGLE